MVTLQVLTDDDRRGAQVFGVDLGRELVRRGRVVRTVALAAGRTGGLDVPLLGRAPLAPTTLRALRREIRAADVVVAHGSTTLPACAAAGAATGVPIVYRNIGDPLYWGDNLARRLRLQLYYRGVAWVVALWAGSARVLAERFGVQSRRLTVIPNGVPADRFPVIDTTGRRDARRALGLPNGTPTVAYLGALTAEKNVDSAVRAVGGLEGAHLVIAGDGPQRAALQALADRVLPGRAHYLGAGDPSRALAAADAVVLPSLSEGMPAALIEAGLSGLPAVATAVGGVAEVVIDGKTGRLVPPRDADALRTALADVLPRAQELGTAARAHCLQRFELGVVAQEWDRVLDGVGR